MTATDAPESFRDLVLAATDQEGAPLPDLDRALIKAGLCASVSALAQAEFVAASAEAYALGGTPQQLQEVVSVVSGLGVHSLMISAVAIVEEGRRAGFTIDAAFTPAEQDLWDTRVGVDPFWADMERELPGFLRALLKLSPDQFEAFFDYCAVPWKKGVVRARTKELLALASDAVSGHRFMPGFRLHLNNAVKLGTGRIALLDALDLASNAPSPGGA